jgi:cytochrome c biogenesis protein CcmG, thiol:disulfide interchange protein DsbE
MNRRFRVLLLAVSLVAAAAFDAQALGAGTKAPNIELSDLSGKPFRLSSFAGKVVLVDFWASWCGPCREELPVLENLYKKYRAKGFEVIGVNQDQDPANASKFLRRTPLSFTVLHDAKRSVAGAYGPDKMPSSYLIDRHGLVRYVHPGFRASDAAGLEREINALLEAR